MSCRRGSEWDPRCGNILRKWHAKSRMGGAPQQREPEHGRCMTEKRGQGWKDNARRKEQIPLGIIVDVVEIHSHLELMFPVIHGQTVRRLISCLFVEVQVRSALSCDQQVRYFQVGLFQNRGEVKAAPRPLKASLIDNVCGEESRI